MQRITIGRILAVVATLLTASLFSVAMPQGAALADCCHDSCWDDCCWDDCNSCASSCWDSCCSAAQKCCDPCPKPKCHTYVRFDAASDAQKSAFEGFWDSLGMASMSAEITYDKQPMEADGPGFSDFLGLIGEEHVYICSDLDNGGNCDGAIFTVYFDESGTQPLQLRLCASTPDPCSTWLWGMAPVSAFSAQPYWRGCQPPDTKNEVYEECDAVNPRHAPRSATDPICKWCQGNS